MRLLLLTHTRTLRNAGNLRALAALGEWVFNFVHFLYHCVVQFLRYQVTLPASAHVKLEEEQGDPSILHYLLRHPHHTTGLPLGVRQASNHTRVSE